MSDRRDVPAERPDGGDLDVPAERPNGGDFGAPDPPGRETVLLGLDRAKNRRLLSAWLSDGFEVTELETAASLDQAFDLCIVDERTFGRYRDRLLARKDEDELDFLPYLLLSSIELSSLPPDVWRHVDAVLETPVAKGELRTRIDSLLDHRRHFLELSQRNALVEAIPGAIQRMNGASDPEGVAEIAVDTAQRAFDLPLTAIWLADETGKRLRPVARTDESESVVEGLPTVTAEQGGPLWQTFVDGETRVFDDLETVVASVVSWTDPERPLRSGLVVPLDKFGVLATGSVVPRRFDDGDVSCVELFAATTASALERADREQALARKNSQMEFFHSILRHDVLNGMQVIQARADLLVEQLDDDRSQHARTIRRWADDVVDVVERVRSVVATLTGDSEHVLRPVDLSDVLEDELAAIRTGYPGVAVETTIPDGVTVRADELLRDVVGNVLANAVEHNEATDLTLGVTVDVGDDFATLRIADDGTGVPDDRKETIFRRGETGHAKATGTGFGLFFVDSMVEKYGGTVWVEDRDASGTDGDSEPTEPAGEADGGDATGAVFVVELPLAEA